MVVDPDGGPDLVALRAHVPSGQHHVATEQGAGVLEADNELG